MPEFGQTFGTLVPKSIVSPIGSNLLGIALAVNAGLGIAVLHRVLMKELHTGLAGKQRYASVALPLFFVFGTTFVLGAIFTTTYQHVEQLQVLRDLGLIEFVSPGVYRRLR